MRTSAKVEKTVRAVAVYDILATGLLVLPPLVLLAMEALAWLDAQLGFQTTFLAPDPTVLFFINLAAASVAAWALIRLRQPTVEMLRIDIGYRLLLVGLQISAVSHGATPILLGISAVLAFIAIVETIVLMQASKPSESSKPSLHGS